MVSPAHPANRTAISKRRVYYTEIYLSDGLQRKTFLIVMDNLTRACAHNPVKSYL